MTGIKQPLPLEGGGNCLEGDMTEISGVLYLDLGEDNMSIYNGQNSANNMLKNVHFTIGIYIL